MHVTLTLSFCTCQTCKQECLHEMYCEVKEGVYVDFLFVERDVTSLVEIMSVLPILEETDMRLLYQSK